MSTPGDRADQAPWQAPLEVDPADAGEQARELVDDEPDPEAPAASRRPLDLDLTSGSEADLTDQRVDVGYDDDGEW